MNAAATYPETKTARRWRGSTGQNAPQRRSWTPPVEANAPEPTLKRWRVAKRAADWSDQDNLWTVLYDDWESLDPNSQAISIENGQFPSFEAALAACWEAIAEQQAKTPTHG